MLAGLSCRCQVARGRWAWSEDDGNITVMLWWIVMGCEQTAHSRASSEAILLR